MTTKSDEKLQTKGEELWEILDNFDKSIPRLCSEERYNLERNKAIQQIKQALINKLDDIDHYDVEACQFDVYDFIKRDDVVELIRGLK